MEGDATADSPDARNDMDDPIEEAPDVPADAAPEPSRDPLPELPLADGTCCPDPLILDPTRGICIDSSRGGSCEEAHEACPFGQQCEGESGIMLFGMFCHIPCRHDTDFLCPERWVCDPERCCDIPERGCVPDRCEPPLLMRVDLYECVSTDDLGADCSDTSTCGTGQSCLLWYDEAGEARRTCEIVCPEDWPRLCPNGYRCVDRADGPSSVCEPVDHLHGCDDPNALTCGHPEKLDEGLLRTTVCPDCDGLSFCIDDDYLDLLSYLEYSYPMVYELLHSAYAPPSGVCDPPLSEWAVSFRPGTDDCVDSLPSDFFWTSVCILAHIDRVVSIHCHTGD